MLVKFLGIGWIGRARDVAKVAISIRTRWCEKFLVFCEVIRCVCL